MSNATKDYLDMTHNEKIAYEAKVENMLSFAKDVSPNSPQSFTHVTSCYRLKSQLMAAS